MAAVEVGIIGNSLDDNEKEQQEKRKGNKTDGDYHRQVHLAPGNSESSSNVIDDNDDNCQPKMLYVKQTTSENEFDDAHGFTNTARIRVRATCRNLCSLLCCIPSSPCARFDWLSDLCLYSGWLLIFLLGILTIAGLTLGVIDAARGRVTAKPCVFWGAALRPRYEPRTGKPWNHEPPAYLYFKIADASETAVVNYGKTSIPGSSLCVMKRYFSYTPKFEEHNIKKALNEISEDMTGSHKGLYTTPDLCAVHHEFPDSGNSCFYGASKMKWFGGHIGHLVISILAGPAVILLAFFIMAMGACSEPPPSNSYHENAATKQHNIMMGFYSWPLFLALLTFLIFVWTSYVPPGGAVSPDELLEEATYKGKSLTSCIRHKGYNSTQYSRDDPNGWKQC